MSKANISNNLSTPAQRRGGPPVSPKMGQGRPISTGGMPVQEKPKGHKGLWVLVLILVILLIVVAVAYKIMLSEPEEVNLNQPVNDSSEIKAEEPSAIYYSYTGTISKITPEQIIIEAKADGYLLMENTQIKISLSDETAFIKSIMPATIDSQMTKEEILELFKKENITMDDLSLGDEIMAVSNEDVKDKTEITATRIELRILE